MSPYIPKAEKFGGVGGFNFTSTAHEFAGTAA